MTQSAYLSGVMVRAASKRIRPVAHERRSGLWLFCGLWLLLAGPVWAGNFYGGITPATVPWTNGIVPYLFTNALTPAQQQTYLDGLREWQLAANIQFVPRTTQNHWILFTYNTNFIDNVSASTNPQVVTVSSLSRAQVCHEMGHSFGLNHENIRIDQTNYLTVVTNNIFPPSNLSFFNIDPTTVTNGPYDFESVMHLGNNFSSSDPLNPTIYTQLARPAYVKFQPRMGNLCLSKGDRAALSFLYGAPLVPLSNIVTNTADSGPGSLRAAMYYCADHPGTAVHFNIPTGDAGHSNGVYTIHLTGYLPPLVTDGMVIDGSTQPGFTSKPLIIVDGSQMIPEAYPPGQVTGLLIYAANCQVKNLSFQNFNWNGVTLTYPYATNNTISGCWMGLDYTGTNPAPNVFQGVFIDNGASSNIIGGTTTLARNVLSGNTQYGVLILGTNTTGNVVLGNYIGTDAGGSRMVSNSLGGVFLADGANHNTIGGTNTGAGNVISGNLGNGILLRGSNVLNNTVAGNFIGTDATGTNSLPNTIDGVAIDTGSSFNLIGGSVAGARNIISGNAGNGIQISGPTAGANTVQGNFIGTDVTGMRPLPNPIAGVTIDTGSRSNLVGGTVAGARNVISGNTNLNFSVYGVIVAGSGTSGNVVEGNYIGVGSNGVTAVPNLYGLICSAGATSNTFGGSVTGARNVISGNASYGMLIINPGTGGNVVAGNYIGLDAGGMVAVPNFDGIISYDGATNNTIGGTSAGAGNYISGNLNYGISLIGPSDRNLVEGNFFGIDKTGTNGVGNFDNVELQDGATGNVIGGVAAGAGNVIAFANGNGVVVYTAGTTNNPIRGNAIFGNAVFGTFYLGIDLNGDSVTPNDTGDADTGPNNLQNFPVITNAYGFSTTTIIAGKLNSLASRTFFVDVYRNITPDASGNGQGQFYAGTVNVTTDGSGNANFSLTNTAGNYAGQYFTATATSANGDTSEFSTDVLATNAPAPSASFTGLSLVRTNGFGFTVNLTTNFSYRIQTTTNLAQNPVVWADLTNFTATNVIFNFVDHAATNFHVRFYRVKSP